MKRILIIIVALILIIGAGIFYLNNVIIPLKVKSVLVKSLEEQTRKNVTLESLQFSVFKGLVLRNLVIYDNGAKFLSLKQGSCVFLVPPVFRGIISIPNIKLKALEFSKDGFLLRSNADLNWNFQYNLKNKQMSRLEGAVKVFNTEASGLNTSIQNIGGTIEFNQGPDKWFTRARLSSKDFSLDSDLEIRDKLVTIKQSSVKYLDSVFSFSGDITGNISDFKSCVVKVNVSSPKISAYGYKFKDFNLAYNQSGGIGDIAPIHLILYGGTFEGKANIDFNSAGLPFEASADIQGVKLQELKLDTSAKDKDIEGTLQAQVKLNGPSNDISKLNGSGNISVTNGKLWQLNIFQGLGSLLFADKAANIVFNEGSCDFVIKDKHILSDNLRLKSNVTDLSATAKIGFDSSIGASVSVQVLDQMVPLSGTLQNIATAVAGEGGVLGVIKISGTLQKPKYKFKPAVANIIKGITDILFGK